MYENKLIKNFFIYFFRNIVTSICPILIFSHASKRLGAELVGRISFSQSIVSYFLLFSSVAISGYGIREVAKRQGNKTSVDEILSQLFTINIVVMFLSFVVLFAVVFFSPQLKEYSGLIAVLSLDIIGNVIGVDWLYRGLEKFQFISIRTIFLQILSVILMISSVHGKEDIDLYILVLLIPTVGAGICNYICSISRIRICFTWSLLKRHFKPILLTFGIGVTANLYLMLDTTMLGLFLGDYEVGIYSAASKIVKMVVTLVSALCSVFVPRLSYLFNNSREEDYAKLIKSTFNIIIGFCIPGVAGIALLSEEIIVIFCGREFLEAVYVLRVLSVDLLFASISGFFAWQVLMPQNKEGIIFKATLLGGGINFVLNLIFIPKYGVISAAISTICAEIIVGLFCLKNSLNIERIKELLFEIKGYLFAAILLLPIIYSVKKIFQNEILIIIWGVFFSTITYTLFLVIIQNPYIKELLKLIKKGKYGENK